MRPSLAATTDPAYLEELHRQWRRDPGSLDDSWQAFFQGFELASRPGDGGTAPEAREQSGVASLIYNYRDQGHRIAHTNPLRDPPASTPDLEIGQFGFDEADLRREFDTGHLHLGQRATLGDIVEMLRETYCRSVGAEYLHIQNVAIRRWLQARMEPTRNRLELDRVAKLDILQQLTDAELFETFIQRRYLGQKRFSVEGGETLIPLVHWIVEQAPELGVEELVLGMAHRGRLNVLANLLDKSYSTIFAEFEDNFLPGAVGGDGDVKYHKGFSSTHRNRRGKTLRLSLTANPSHLEAVDPVVLGRTRAKQRQLGDSDERKRVVPLLIHGDSAFAGQGIVAETLNLSRLDGYEVGGTIHVVVNNQIGFTTLPGEARSSQYATDVAKIIGAPIFHVNGDDPEAAVYVADLALRFRHEFGRDVVIDLICFRRHGHSEIDEPTYTQPKLYRTIREHPTVRRIYAAKLVSEGELEPAADRALAMRFEARLEQAHEQARSGQAEPQQAGFEGDWADLDRPFSHEPVATGVEQATLTELARKLAEVPEGFRIDRKLARQLPKRAEAVEHGGSVDWALAEALAFGSLLVEGTPVRLSGQDSERGTFSQRHSVWRDGETMAKHVPLNHLDPGQARFCVYNSPLSEASVLGFEYGYSLSEPHMLNLWEAQFGDFANGAQVIIDQFIVAAQSKWQRVSGLVMLLPHGYEGQGPEHSNAYLERYLAACAEDNIQVCYPSTPAQYFHVLRRQVRRPLRRPLILMTPKSLLRHRLAVSPVDELVDGRFQEMLDDPERPEAPRRLILSSGKVYYDLVQARQKERVEDAALVRIEQLYPFHDERFAQLIEDYAGVEEVVWCQEEPRNRGAWSFLQCRLNELFSHVTVRYAGRRAAASPAVGSLHVHRQEQAALVRDALGLDERS